MKNRTQTLITLAFLLLFAVSVPLVLLTTAGYRINLRTQRLEATGILLVRSAPPDAELLLDGVPQNARTPARLPRLLPRAYDVTVRKPGFHDWSKTLTVESRRTTFAENVVLFSEQLPERVADADARALAAATNAAELAFLLAGDRPLLVPERASSTAAAGATSTLLWQQDGLTYAGRATTSTLLIDVRGANGSLLREGLIHLPPGDERFLASPPGLLTFLGGGRVRVFDAATGEPRLEREARGAIWRTDNSRELLVWSDFELWIAQPDGNAALLTRIGTPILQAAWYPGGSHVLYTTGTTLAAIERDDRDGRLITPLFALPGLGAFAVDEKGAAIYAIAAPAGKPGVFRYPIALP